MKDSGLWQFDFFCVFFFVLGLHPNSVGKWMWKLGETREDGSVRPSARSRQVCDIKTFIVDTLALECLHEL